METAICHWRKSTLLSELFALDPVDPVRAAEFGVELVDGVNMLLSRRVCPQLQVVPLECSCVLTQVQAAHDRILHGRQADGPWSRTLRRAI